MVGESFDTVEWVGLNEEEGKKLIEKYNKEGKEAGFDQQQSAKRPRLDKTEGNRETRDSRNSRDARDHRDRRNNCRYYYMRVFVINYAIVLYRILMIQIKIEVAILLGVVIIWVVGEAIDCKEVDI